MLRWWGGYTPILQTETCVTVSLLTALPVGFLAGLGAFDYWVHYFLGKPTRPEDHSGHGAKTWKDYFRVNTDHKVIGIQYVTTTIFFFFVPAGCSRCWCAPSSPAGDAVPRHGDLQRPLLGARLADDLPVRDPGLRGPRELRHPADDRRAGHGVPAPERPLVLAAADRRDDDADELPGRGRPVRGRLDGLPDASTSLPLGQTFFNMAVQWAGASSVLTALNFLVTIITMRAPGMTFWRMPLLVWANFTTSLLVVIATPFIAGSQFMVLFDRVWAPTTSTPT